MGQVFKVQVRKEGYKYSTHTTTDKWNYAVMQYKGINVGKPYTKRLVEVSEDGSRKVIHRVKGL
jgi:hypothetical protein